MNAIHFSGASFQNHYLTLRTEIPITVADNLIINPAVSRTGTNKPISRVTVLSGLGNLADDNVASSRPSGYREDNILIGKKKRT